MHVVSPTFCIGQHPCSRGLYYIAVVCFVGCEVNQRKGAVAVWILYAGYMQAKWNNLQVREPRYVAGIFIFYFGDLAIWYTALIMVGDMYVEKRQLC